jgi:hypothetical protein
VLVWSDFHVPRGDELDRQTSALVHALSERFEVEGIADTLGPAAELELMANGAPVRVHRLPMSIALERRDTAGLLAVGRAAQRVLDAWRPDVIVHEFTGPGGIFVPRVLDQTPVPVLVRSAPPPVAGVTAALGPLLRRTVHWAAPSAACLALWQDELTDGTFDGTLPEFGVRNPLLGLGPPPAAGPDGDGLVLAGRCVAGKGIDVAIDAVALLRDRGLHTTLTIVGDGPERSELQDRIDRHRLGDRVTITGWLPRRDAIELMRGAAVVLAPSQVTESFGAVAIEAAWCGRPVVVTDVGGLPEAAKFGRSGVIVPGGDMPALAGAIADLLTDPARARRLGATGAVLAAVHDEQQVAGLVALIEQAMTGTLGAVRRPEEDA